MRRKKRIANAVTTSSSGPSQEGTALRTAAVPAATPASQASSIPALEARLQRARRLGHAWPPGAARPGLLQRKGNNLPTSQVIEANAGRGTTIISSTHRYEDVLDELVSYESNATTPAASYGLQLFRLGEVARRINLWEQGYGAVTQVDNGTGKKSRRRRQLLLLQTALPLEVTAVQDQGFTAARQMQVDDRQALSNALNAGLLSPDPRTRNSADWIVNAGKSRVYAETPTGDSHVRLLQAGLDPAVDEAFFPGGRRGSAGHVLDALALYNRRNYADNANVELKVNGKVTGGWRDDQAIAIVSPSTKTQDRILEVVRHEVQHDADRHVGREALAGARRGYERVDVLAGLGRRAEVSTEMAKVTREIFLSKYKTEYRAYSYEQSDDYRDLDNTVRDRNRDGHLFTQRQLAIFEHVYANYDQTKSGWDQNGVLPDGRTFREAVAAYRDPDSEGFNKFNSARIDDFYNALDVLGTKRPATYAETYGGRDYRPVQTRETDDTAGAVTNLVTAIQALDRNDVDYLRGGDAHAMATKITAHLGGAALERVRLAFEVRELDFVLRDMTPMLELIARTEQLTAPSFRFKPKEKRSGLL